MPKNVTVIAHLPATIEISHRASSKALRIDVKIAGSKKGTLSIGRGSVEWWPEFNSVNAHRASWQNFIEILEGMPRRRSRKTIARKD
jgi:hypothetical protein